MTTSTHAYYRDKPDIWSSHSRIADRLSAFPAGTRVLDVGTATGTIGRMCQGMGLRLDGIEPDHEMANLARPYYEAIEIRTLESCPDQFLEGHNVVICGDVLEHIANPESALQRLRNLQPDGCLFIISVPNIAHIWIRLNLLLGRFDRADRGILDRTHLKFFTRKSATQMIMDAGLAIERIVATPVPLDLVSPFFSRFPIGRLCYWTLRMGAATLPTVLGYQFVIEASKENRNGCTQQRKKNRHRSAGLQRRKDAHANTGRNSAGVLETHHPC